MPIVNANGWRGRRLARRGGVAGLDRPFGIGLVHWVATARGFDVGHLRRDRQSRILGAAHPGPVIAEAPACHSPSAMTVLTCRS